MSQTVAPDPQSFLLQEGIHTIELPTPFPVGPVNAYVIKGDPVILFDTGLNTDETYDGLVHQLANINLTLSDIDVIVVTHGHRDHMGLLGRLMEETDAVTFGQPDVDQLGTFDEDDAALRRDFFIGILREFGVPADIREKANSLYDRFKRFSEPFQLDHHILDDQTVLGYSIHYVPGHSPTDTLFVQEDRGYTVVGDHILTNTNPNPLLRRPEQGKPRARSLVEYQASLRKSRDLNLGICLPGHGEPFGDHIAAVDRILERQEKRTAQVKNLIKSGHTTPYVVSRQLFPKLPPPHLHLGLSIAVGHMEVLEHRDEAELTHADGVLQIAILQA
jgi:glyoxylase-like metal-dependent hydrolase (beta-lactamase superfamily II)